MTKVFDADTPWSDFVADLASLVGARPECQGPLEWAKSIETPKLTCREGLEQYAASSEPDTLDWWATAMLYIYYPSLTPAARRPLFDRIPDTMGAFQIYLRVPDLDESEDKILKGKFQGKLPQAEKELIEGEVYRAKDLGTDPIFRVGPGDVIRTL